MHAGPDFFVVGAPRAATTSLYHALARHPEIFVPQIKEPHFYAWPEVGDTYYDTEFVTEAEDYRTLFDGRADGQVAGDFSTSYLFRYRAAARIHEDNPDARIVIVLRNPVDRALSHHRMDRRDGYTASSLGHLIGPTAADSRFRREYLDVGRYAEQIRAYRQHFDDRQLHIILFEDLVGPSPHAMVGLLRFLGVDDTVEIGSLDVRNHTGAPRSRLGHRLGTKPLAVSFGRRLGHRSRRVARRLLYRPDRTGPDPADRELLVQLLGPEIDELEGVIGRDLSAWRGPEPPPEPDGVG